MADKKRKGAGNKLLALRDEKIIAKFNHMVDKKKDGISIYNLEYIYAELEREFYIEKPTLQKIIKGYYSAKYVKDTTTQLDLFE